MRQRVISSLVGLLILAAVLSVLGTRFFNAVIAVLSLMALFEMLRATGCLESRALAALSFSAALIIPFGHEYLVREWMMQVVFIFFVLFFAALIRNSSTVRVERMSMAFMFSLFIPLFFSCGVFMRDMYGPVAGRFYLLMALGSAWLCDTGAYFAGRLFGRHKLAPLVSPKKTVEGAVGGLIAGTALMQAIALAFVAAAAAFGVRVRIDYATLALLTPVCGVMGMLGDLSASAIKRQFNVKDYGDIMPGHGGVMDRFDSVMFTMPSVFMAARHVELITVL